MTDTAPENSPFTLADIMAELFEIRDRKRELSAEEKELNGRWKDLEDQLLGLLHAQGADKVSTPLGTAIRTETKFPHVIDWDQFHKYVADTGRFELLQRRAAAGAWQELVKIEGPLPGVLEATKVSINLRSK